VTDPAKRDDDLVEQPVAPTPARVTWLQEGSLAIAILLVLGMSVLDPCASVNTALLSVPIGVVILFFGLRSGRRRHLRAVVPLLSATVILVMTIITVDRGQKSEQFLDRKKCLIVPIYSFIKTDQTN
jgi:hypothetical protein